MKRLKVLLLLVTIVSAFALTIAPATASALMAQADDAVSGKWGTCPWEISSDGVLTVHPGTGEDTRGECPWAAYESDIVRVVFASEGGERVIAPSNCSSLLSLGHYDQDKGDYISGVAALDLSGLDTSDTTNMYRMFRGCSSLTSLDLSGLDTSSLRNMECMFQDCSSLTSLDLSGFDTSRVNSVAVLFGDCSSLTSLDLSGLDTSCVTNMSYMFGGCSSLTSLDLSSLDTSRVKYMTYMFCGCSSLTSLDLSGFDTSSVYYMDAMFQDCSSLTSLDLSSFNNNNLSDMPLMFEGCSSLTSLDLSGFDTSNVIDMFGLFRGCSSLTSLDLSYFNTYRANMNEMFDGCSSLRTIYVSGSWSTHGTISDPNKSMFTGCLSLVGGNGTAYDADYVSAEYARIDKADAPGYLTNIADKPVDISSATVTVDDQTYAGSAREPAVTVMLGAKTLKLNTDYAVAYENNVEVGTATVTATGIGHYIGTAIGTFEISPACDRPWTRLADDDRLGTMQAITKAGYSNAETVLVTTGWGDADALTAAGLSGLLHAPILTTSPFELSPQAAKEIVRLNVKRAVILGGPKAVDPRVEEQLEAMGLTVSRLTGDNRIETALKIYEKGVDQWGDTCILSKGWVSADALAAGSYAYANKAPIFLAMPDGTIDAVTAKAVKKFKHVVVLGGTQGTAAIGDKTMKSLGVSSWIRLAGNTRYDTAVALAIWATGEDSMAVFQPTVKLTWQDCAVAFAWNYPDALTGVNVAGPKGSVLLLVSTDVDEHTRDVAVTVRKHPVVISHGYVLGGTSVVSDSVKLLFEQAAG